MASSPTKIMRSASSTSLPPAATTAAPDIDAITVGGLTITLDRKAIKNLHIAVYPPDGRIRVAAPQEMSVEAVRVAVMLRLAWIKRQQARFDAQERQSEREMVSGETHFFQGRGYRLIVEERGELGRVRLEGDRMRLTCPLRTNTEERAGILARWYRRQLRAAADPVVSRFATKLDVSRPSFGIRRMKTKWGSCNTTHKKIWLNLELVKKPMPCLEYVVAHEIAHFVSRQHDETFIVALDMMMPRWRQVRQALNEAPLAHETW